MSIATGGIPFVVLLVLTSFAGIISALYLAVRLNGRR